MSGLLLLLISVDSCFIITKTDRGNVLHLSVRELRKQKMLGKDV